MNAFDVSADDKAKKLMSLKPNEDYVWIAIKQDLFKT